MLKKTKMDKTLYPLKGIVPIVNTPFTESNIIDYDSVNRLIEQGIKDGIVGCIVPAVASEVSQLSDTERKEFVEKVIEIGKDKISVIAGVSHQDPNRSRAFLDHAVESGADGVLCAVPMDIIEDKQSVKRYFSNVVKSNPPMLMIQDLHWSSFGMSIDTIRDLWEEIDSFRCLKLETVPSGYKISQILEATDNNLAVGIGWSLPQFIEALDRGTSFFTTTAINKPFVHIYNLYNSGKRTEAINLFDSIVPFLAFAFQHIDISIQFFKHYCNKRGLFQTTNTRSLSIPFDNYHETITTELIDRIIEIEDNL